MTTALRLLCGLLLACASLARAYEFPIQDGFAASIVGTPPELRAPLPERVPVRTYRLEPLGPVPEVFWYQEGLEFSLAPQPGRAPLVFLVAGTGAAHDGAKMVGLQKALYAAGFHVLNLPSATHFNFIVNASRSHLVGFLPADTLDTYAVMQRAWERVRGDIEADGFLVAGYSLGGITAAFLAAHDEKAGAFGFRRALMINPPVDLYASAHLLDGYLSDNLLGSGAVFLDEVIDRLAVAYRPDEGLRMDEDFLYRAYDEIARSPGAESRRVRDVEEALVGISFRLSSSAMVFSADVMTRSGYIAPADKAFGRADNLEYYAWASAHVPFTRYVDELLIPALLAQRAGATREQLLHEASLRGIEPFLRGGKVWAISNADEIILAPGDLDYLGAVLGERLRVYPRGGHCGNILHRDNVRDMVAVLRGGGFGAGEG